MIRLWFLFALFLPFAAFGQVFPPQSSPMVNDFANVLGQDARDRATDVLDEIFSTHGVTAVLVTMRAKSDYAQGVTLEEFATDLFNEWGIGDAERNHGILLLYLHQDREVRVELGGAYGQDWNHWAAIVVDDVLVPNFKAGRTEVGLIKGVEAIRDEIAVPFVMGEDAPRPMLKKPRKSLSEYIPFLFISGVVALLGFNIFKGLDRFRRCPNCGQRGHIRTQMVPDDGGYDPKYNTGMKITDCANCQYHDESRYMHRKSSNRNGSSRGFGSGGGSSGGGSSGGGGASGRW